MQVNPVTGQVHLYRRVLARITWNTPLSLAATKEQEISPAFEHVLKETSSIYGQTLRWNLGNTPAGRYTATIMAQVRSTGLAHDQILLDQAHLTDANGGDQVLQLETTVHDSPTVGLSTFNDSPTELGDRTTLSASMTSGTNAVYTWDFGDGSPLQAGTPIKHTYPATGTYTARVTATNSVSSQAQVTTVTITDVPPAASFISSSPDILGQTTIFQSTSTGTNLTHHWDFGDGSPPVSSRTPIITHTYTYTDTYTAVLILTNSAGSSTAVGTVDIVSHPDPRIASFTSSSPDEIGQTTVFINTSQDGGDEEENVSYAWIFGDGTISAARHPTHTYAAVGTYLVSLTITNRFASDTFSDTVLIGDVPISGLSIEEDSPTILDAVTTLSGTTTSGTNISYLWTLGDGTLGTGQNLTHAYGAVGNYGVVLTTTNSLGSLAVTGTVTIVDEPIDGLSISYSGPTYLGSSATFTAVTTAGTNLVYLWDLGDGITSTLKNLVHTYRAVGDYTVVLTVTNGWGSLVSFDIVSICDVPISGLGLSHDGPTTLGMPTAFTATVAAGTNVVYNWEFGDGQTATGAHLTHVYAVPGTYDVTVTAINRENESVASTSVTILHPDLLLFLPLMLRNSSP